MTVSNINNNSVQEYVFSAPHKRQVSALDGKESEEKRLKTEPFPLEQLTDDIIAEVLSHLDFPELKQIRCANKRLNLLSKCDAVWEKIAGKIGVPITREPKRSAEQQIIENHKNLINNIKEKELCKNNLTETLYNSLAKIISEKLTVENLFLVNQVYHSTALVRFLTLVKLEPKLPDHVLSEIRTISDATISDAWLHANNFQEVLSLAQKARNLFENHKDLFSSKIKKCDLQDCDLTIIPSEIGKLSSLTNLVLGVNDLNTLPSQIASLASLTNIFLMDNYFTTFPLEICNLSSLRILNLSGNKITIIPPEIGNLKRLTRLDISDNKFTSFPTEIFKLSLLKELDLSENQITEIPPEIGYLSSLRKLILGKNKISVIPPQICKLLPLLDELDITPTKSPIFHLKFTN